MAGQSEEHTAHVTTLAQVSAGVSIGRLSTGSCYVAAHKDRDRVIVELSRDELATLLDEARSVVG